MSTAMYRAMVTDKYFAYYYFLDFEWSDDDEYIFWFYNDMCFYLYIFFIFVTETLFIEENMLRPSTSRKDSGKNFIYFLLWLKGGRGVVKSRYITVNFSKIKITKNININAKPFLVRLG